MLIEKSLRDAELTMQGDALPKKDRTVKAFQRLIAAMRATEAEVIEQLSTAQTKLNETLNAKQELQDKCHRLENELRAMKLRVSLEGIEALTVDDRAKLLEYSGA